MRKSAAIALGFVTVFAVEAIAAVTPRMPVTFIPNRGQAEPDIRYLATGPEFQATFYGRKVVMRRGGSRMEVQFRNASTAEIVGTEPTGAVANYVFGGDPASWKTGLPMQAELSYRGLWPGVQLRYKGGKTQLKAEYVVSPGASVDSIQVIYDGRIALDSDGSLRVNGKGGVYREARPVIYQMIHGQRREIAGGFRAHDSSTLGFWVGDYDPALELIVDPVITYSTLFGGSSQDDITGVGYDAALNTYTAGYTSSPDLPVMNPAKPRGGGVDAFVAKYGVGTGRLIYCTYLGGSGDDRAFGLAVDPAGQAFVTGWTSSTNFPLMNALQPRMGGSRSAFVAKLNAAGSGLVYSTYFGGSGVTTGNAIAIDRAGEAAIAGDTTSTNLPVTRSFQPTLKGAQDAFVLKLDASGRSIFCSYFGGSNIDHAATIAMDAAGSMAIGGSTYSTDLPLQSAYQTANSGSQTGFVAYMAGNGASLFFSSYLGGSSGSASHPEGVTAVVVDENSAVPSVYAAGVTSSQNFPITAGAYQTLFGGGSDGFIARFTAVGGLLSSTFLGGSLLDGINALAIDFYGNPHVGGFTSSTDFPTVRAVQQITHGSRDAFVAKLDKTLDKVLYSTYLGGVGTDSVNALAVDSMGTVLVAGQTSSLDFPLLKQAQSGKGGTLAGFVTKIAPGWTAAVFYRGLWLADTSHSRGSDGSAFSGTVWAFGQAGDVPVVGDWDGSGTRKIGVFRNGTWILDTNGNGQIDAADRTFVFGQAGDLPVVGDWDGTGRVRAGIFRSGNFTLDYSGHLTGTPTGRPDVAFAFGQAGDIPVAGDWNGSGTTKVGVFRSGLWLLDYTGDHASARTYTYGAGGDFPLVGDWDGAGISKIGIFRNPAWCFDYDGDYHLTTPGANELLFWYGIPNVWPVIL